MNIKVSIHAWLVFKLKEVGGILGFIHVICHLQGIFHRGDGLGGVGWGGHGGWGLTGLKCKWQSCEKPQRQNYLDEIWGWKKSIWKNFRQFLEWMLAISHRLKGQVWVKLPVERENLGKIFFWIKDDLFWKVPNFVHQASEKLGTCRALDALHWEWCMFLSPKVVMYWVWGWGGWGLIMKWGLGGFYDITWISGKRL